MKLFDRLCGRVGKPFGSPVIFLLMAVCSVILFYSVFAYPFYTAVKVNEMKKAYQILSEVNFAELGSEDEEDKEVLQGFADDRLEIMITDSDFKPVYSNRTEQQAHQNQIIERYIVPYESDFKEKPCIYIRKNEKFRSIRLRGRFVQNESVETETSGEEQKQKVYYVYIRLLIRSVGVIFDYTTKYLCAAAALCFLLGYLLLRARSVKLVLVSVQEYEKEMYGAKYGGKSEEDMKARDEFVASVSHELKTPLAVISGQMEMLQSMGDRIDRDYYFTSIREEIDKMSNLVGNLLDLTIMEHQIEEMEMREMDFSGMVRYMAQKYDALFRRNRIILTTRIEEGCTVYGNRTYLEQALNNYIMNAFQHTSQGKEIRITLSRENGSAKLCVYNEGSFVPPKEQERIWQGFYKEAGDGRTRLRGFQNAGLGLYFVKKITELHHGECGVRNLENGVEFWLAVPLME